ncbi:B12-binding domain-containing radical SAM protein [bacterium]|nr:B12-binding domain-containing radical SAM protein [bacterium]
MKNIKKIILIEPKSPDRHIFGQACMPRLGLPILGTILKEKGHEVRIYCQDIKKINYSDVFSADLVGISTTTSTAPEGYLIADKIKAHHSKIPVVIGGAHATFLPEEALSHCDYVIRGEGEYVFPELIEALENHCTVRNIKGLSYTEGTVPVHNPGYPKPVSLDHLPIPDFSLVLEREKMTVTPISTSRGCPFHCSFCSVTPMFGKKYRFRNTDLVIEEIKRDKKKRIFFYDDNFTANKTRSKVLLEKMLENNLRPEWMAQARVDVAKDKDLLKLMQKTNCFIVQIGFESINPLTLKSYNKGQTVEEIEESIMILHQYKIKIHGMFMFGSDDDEIETLKQTVKFAKRLKLDTIQFLTLVPFCGTKVYSDLDAAGRIFTKNWVLYDGHHVVFEPKKMSPFELQIETFKAMKKFYSLWRCLKSFWKGKSFTAMARYWGNRTLKKWGKDHKPLFDQLKLFSRKLKINRKV